MWLLYNSHQHPEGNTELDQHGAMALYSTLEYMMHAIQSEDNAAEKDAVHCIMLTLKC